MRLGNRKVLQGTVVSNKMQKSIMVDVERRYKHPKYGKYVLQTKKYAAHDESNEAQPGDRVEIAETRKISKRKCWRLLRITAHAPSRGGTAS